MDNEEIHFLDTNILLAIVLPDDENYKETKNYLDYSCFRYISNTAKSEAENKIRKIRRISLKITEYTKKYSLNHQINPLKIKKHLYDIKKGFIKQYGDDPFPEDLKKEKFDYFVFAFFSEYEPELNDILMRGDNTELNKTIISSFRLSIRKLLNFLRLFTCITFIEKASKYEDLRKINIDKMDAILLEESYCLHIQLNKEIYFITFDKGILDFDDEIKKILTSKIQTISPIQLLNH